LPKNHLGQQGRATVCCTKLVFVSKCDTSQPLPILKDLPIASKYNDFHGLLVSNKSRLQGKDKLGIVNSREVARPGRLHLFGLRGKGKAVNKVLGDEGMPLVGHHEPEVAALATAETIVTVEDELDLVNGVPVVYARVVKVVVLLPLASATRGPDKLNDRVVEVDGEVDLAAGLYGQREALDRVHELLEAGGGKAITLRTVQVDIEALEVNDNVGVLDSDATRAVDHTGGHIVGRGAQRVQLDAVAKAGQLHNDLHRVELQGDEGQGIAGVVGEPEGQGDVEGAGKFGVGHQLGNGEALANHLGEALAGLPRKLLPHEEIVVVHGVNNLATDNHTDPLGDVLTNGIDPMAVGQLETGANFRGFGRGKRVGGATAKTVAGRGFDAIATGVTGVDTGEVLATGLLGVEAGDDAGDSDLEVGKVQEIAGPIEAYLDLGAEAGAHDGLADGFKDKVSVFCVAEAPKSDGGVLGKKFVHSTQTNQLGQGTLTRSSKA